MIEFADWVKSYQNLSSVGVHSSHEVRGLCKKVLGGRALFAEVEISISPSSELKFIQKLSINDYEIADKEGWINAICLGVLDVMIVRPLIPISAFECSIKFIGYHNIDSSKQAFRMAGRNAAEQFLAQEKFVTL